jgi:hypothetical protein
VPGGSRSGRFFAQAVNGGGAIHAKITVAEHSSHAKHIFPGGSNGLNVFRSNFTKNIAVSPQSVFPKEIPAASVGSDKETTAHQRFPHWVIVQIAFDDFTDNVSDPQ